MSAKNLIKGINIFLTEHTTSEPFDSRFGPLLKFIMEVDVIVQEEATKILDGEHEEAEEFYRYLLKRRIDKGYITKEEEALLYQKGIDYKTRKPYWEQLWRSPGRLSYFDQRFIWALIETSPKKLVISPEGEKVVAFFQERSPIEKEKHLEINKLSDAIIHELNKKNTSAFLEKLNIWLNSYSEMQIRRNETIAKLLYEIYQKNKWAKILLIMGNEHIHIKDHLEQMGVLVHLYQNIKISKEPKGILILKKLENKDYFKSPNFRKEAYLYTIFKVHEMNLIIESHFSPKQYVEAAYKLYNLLKGKLTEEELEKLMYMEYKELTIWLSQNKHIELSDYFHKVRTPRKPQ